MDRPFGLAVLALAALPVSGALSVVHADASVASVAMGGIQFRKEARISMEKERLRISAEEIRVEYEFLNQTSEDITVDLAFPMADRECHPWKATGDSEEYHPNFRLWVEGAAQNYKTETQAVVHNRNFSPVLRKLGIDIATCGHHQEGKVTDFSTLSKEDLRRLSTLGLLSEDGLIPQWTVREFYYWTQTFSVSRVLHVSHVYKPGAGQSEQVGFTTLLHLKEFCLDPTIGQKIARDVAGPDFEAASGYVYQWVDYILKTGNNWQGPIKDFQLEIEQPPTTWVNFCWQGPVERLGPGHIRIKSTDLTPRQNLHIVFLPK